MQVVTGTIVQGKVVLEGVSLPEGTVVTVLAKDSEASVRLAPALQAELEESLEEADREEGISGNELLEKTADVRLSVALIVRIKPRAVRQIEAAASWWRENRPAAPGAIRSDLKAALEALVEQPGIGTLVENPRDPQTRRLYLARTRYFVYYRPRGQYLEVVAFWHSGREHAPGV